MNRVTEKFVPRLFTEDQRIQHISVCEDPMKQMNDDENYFEKVITRNETWVYRYHAETKWQSMLQRSPDLQCPKTE
jgi:hypothetical protein